jgi:hypothetical protein
MNNIVTWERYHRPSSLALLFLPSHICLMLDRRGKETKGGKVARHTAAREGVGSDTKTEGSCNGNRRKSIVSKHDTTGTPSRRTH